MDITKLADSYADSIVQLKFARIDKAALRSTSSAGEVLAATTAVLSAKKAVVSARKALLEHACIGVKERLGWLAKVDPNQIPLILGPSLDEDTDHEDSEGEASK